MRNISDLAKFLENCPQHTPLITDRELEALLPVAGVGHTDDGLKPRLFAEAWTRHWLYVPQWPRSQVLTDCLAVFSTQFQEAFKNLAQPWRELRADGDPFPPAEPPDAGLQGEELAIWQYFWGRLRDFVRCDGLIAMVLQTKDDLEDQEAVAVPFRLNGTKKIRDASQRTLEEWSKAIGWLQEDYYPHPLGADLLAVFPPDVDLTGESVTLAVLLARERERAVALPEFHPLSVLATGKFRSGMLEAVGGLKAKAALAERVGCRWFLRPSDGQPSSTIQYALLLGTPLAEMLPQIGQWLADSADEHKLARRALADCEKRLQAEGHSQAETAGVFRRLMRIQTTLACTPEAESCRKALCVAARRMKATSFEKVESQVECLLKQYRQRPFHGREPALSALDRFLDGSGGITLVTGKVGFGKTALMTQLLNRVPRGRVVFRHFFSLNLYATRPLENFHNQLGLFLAAILGKPEFDSTYDEGAVATLFDELREKPTHKLVIILDGLDEAEEVLQPYYLRDLPKGVHVIAAARSSGDGEPERFLESWLELQPTLLNLAELDDQELSLWLHNHDSAPLRFLSANAVFRQLLRDRASGCPRFIADVVAYLATVENVQNSWQTRLAELPKDYSDFVRKQFRQLESTPAFNSAHKTFLGLLCAAEGELSEREVQLLFGEMPKLPVECDRWLSCYSGSDGDGVKYGLQTRQIRDALRNEIPWRDQQAQLLKFCEQWAEHGKSYALRNYTVHLAADKKWKEIAELVLTDTFRMKITECIPDEPDLPIRLLRGAFRCAVFSKDWEGTALLMLARVELSRRIFDIRDLTNGSPEDSAATAAKVLDHADPGRAALLRLIQVWMLILNRHPQPELEAVRQVLSSSRLPMLSGLEADVASALLVNGFEADDERLADIARRLLDEQGRLELLVHLVALKTDAGFAGARRVLTTLLRSHRKLANLSFDRAVTCLAVGLAEANHWDESLELIESLLPRQQSLNLVRLARVASAQNSLPKLGDLKRSMSRLVAACPGDMKEFNARGKFKGWKGTPDDRTVCLGNHLSLNAWSAIVETPENITVTWRSIANAANNLDFRARFNALHDLAQAVLTAANNPQFSFVSQQPRRGGDSFLLNALWKTVKAWQDMSEDGNSTLAAVAHELVKLVRLAEDIQHHHPDPIGKLPGLIAKWRDILCEHADNLSPGNREDLWLRIAKHSCESPEFAVGRTMLAIRNLSDRKYSSRAVGWLVRRLQDDGKWMLVPSIAKGNKPLAASIWLAYGLATLDAKPEKAFRKLLRSCLPERRNDSVQVAVLKADLAAALWKSLNRDSCTRLLNEARDLVLSHPNIRFVLEVAEAAHRAHDNRIRDELLAKAKQIALETLETANRGSQQNHSETEQLRQSDYIKAVDTLCALACTIFKLSLAGHADLPPPRSVLEWAWGIARDRVPGISSRTGALAEVAEAAAIMEQRELAQSVMWGMRDFVDNLGGRFGEQRIKYERQTCLGELVLGFLKTDSNGANGLKARLYESGTGTHKRLIQDPTALHALSWLLVRENDLKDAWPLLRQIKSPAIRAKAARDVAIELTEQGRWRHVVGVAAFIEGSEFKQKHLHKIVKAVAASKKIKEFQSWSVYGELLWPCSETFDSVLATLAHLVRYEDGAGLPVAKALAWGEALGIVERPMVPCSTP